MRWRSSTDVCGVHSTPYEPVIVRDPRCASVTRDVRRLHDVGCAVHTTITSCNRLAVAASTQEVAQDLRRGQRVADLFLLTVGAARGVQVLFGGIAGQAL